MDSISATNHGDTALAGKTAEARALYERLLGRQRLSKNGQARLSKVMEALGI